MSTDCLFYSYMSETVEKFHENRKLFFGSFLERPKTWQLRHGSSRGPEGPWIGPVAGKLSQIVLQEHDSAVSLLSAFQL